LPQTIQVGTILIEDRPLIAHHLAISTKPYAANWRVVEGADGFALDRQIHAAGWNFFFFAGEVRSVFLGAPHGRNLRNALKRILVKVSKQNFNCLEVTAIASKRFAGVPYTIVSGHRRHIQQGWLLDRAEHRWAEKKRNGRAADAVSGSGRQFEVQ
jgi:hypothetical protein